MAVSVPTPPEIARAADMYEVAQAMHLPCPTGRVERGCHRVCRTSYYLFLFPFSLFLSLFGCGAFILWIPFLCLFPLCNARNSDCRSGANWLQMTILLPAYLLVQAVYPETRTAQGGMSLITRGTVVFCEDVDDDDNELAQRL